MAASFVITATVKIVIDTSHKAILSEKLPYLSLQTSHFYTLKEDERLNVAKLILAPLLLILSQEV